MAIILRRGIINKGIRSKPRPDEEGIETLCDGEHSCTLLFPALRSKPRPDEEGIETL